MGPIMENPVLATEDRIAAVVQQFSTTTCDRKVGYSADDAATIAQRQGISVTLHHTLLSRARAAARQLTA